jgi:hypothetical protein
MFKKGLLAFIVILVFGAVFYLFVTEKKDRKATQSIVIKEDDFFDVNLKSLDLDLALTAKFIISDTIKLSFKVGGLLEKGETKIELENSFKKNQLLFQINNRTVFLDYLQLKNQFQTNREVAINILENILSPGEIVQWKMFSDALKENQLIADFPVITKPEEQKVIQNLNLSKNYNELKSLESSMSNYFYLAPFDGKILKLVVKIGTKIQKNETVALLLPNNAKIIKVAMDSSQFNEIRTVQKVCIESANFVQNLDWNSKTIMYKGGEVLLFFNDKNWNRFDMDKVFRFILKGKTGKKYAWIPSVFIENDEVKSIASKSNVKVLIHKKLKDFSLVSGLKPGMKIMR